MDLDFRVIADNSGVFIQGVMVTVVLSIVSFPLALALGLVVALLRMGGPRLVRAVAIGYVELFRTTPPLVQLLWLYLVFPIAFGFSIPAVVAGVVGLVLNAAAFLAETFRAGILSVERGQVEAAFVLGLSKYQTFLRITLPRAISTVLPDIGNIAVAMFVQTSLVSILAVAELTYWGQVLAARTFRPVEVFTTVAVIYFLLAYPASLVLQMVEGRRQASVVRGYR